MAHQSGIRVSDELAAAFHSAAGRGVRAIKVQIAGEALAAAGEQAAQGALEEDLDRVPQLLDAAEPCYVLVRLDADPARWLLAAYVPDAARVRAKMLYASTKATLARSLGDSHFADDMFGTAPDEFSGAGYRRHRQHAESAAPLTQRELEMERVRDLESASASAAATMDDRRSHVRPAPCVLAPEAEAALARFAAGTVNFVLLAVDAAAEAVRVVREASLQSHADLARAVPADAPSYVLYWYDSATSVFIYSCPAASSVRDRMVHSTFRRAFAAAARDAGISVDVRPEFDCPADITGAALAAEVAARAPGPAAPPPPRFKRPAPPGRRPRTKE
ncbi:Twinfilin-1 [Coemansia javaensis]|uniref:Twinfilin-1 n=1 Tax=Coemansia javaensis TaxID=2761396 RepID=A0A9W8HDL0_9FUNG|nr:Twinfilin-1 [Coemansia javaensis]